MPRPGKTEGVTVTDMPTDHRGRRPACPGPSVGQGAAKEDGKDSVASEGNVEKVHRYYSVKMSALLTPNTETTCAPRPAKSRDH